MRVSEPTNDSLELPPDTQISCYGHGATHERIVDPSSLCPQQAATASAFFHAMAMSPIAQRRAQEELASVIGLARLPTIDDIASLPYLQAVILEVMRWIPVLPLGVPHRSLEDDEYNGCFIPAGTVICGVRRLIISAHVRVDGLTEHRRMFGMLSTYS